MSQLREIFDSGIKLGMCEKFKQKWRDDITLNALCKMFYLGMDFCIEHDWPSIEQINGLDEDILHHNGIFFNGKYRVPAKKDMCVMGDAQVTIVVPDNMILCDITIRHNANVMLEIGSGAVVYVSIYNNASVSIIKKDKSSRLVASHFGGNINNAILFNKIHDKRKEE